MLLKVCNVFFFSTQKSTQSARSCGETMEECPLDSWVGFRLYWWFQCFSWSRVGIVSVLQPFFAEEKQSSWNQSRCTNRQIAAWAGSGFCWSVQSVPESPVSSTPSTLCSGVMWLAKPCQDVPPPASLTRCELSWSGVISAITSINIKKTLGFKWY